MTIRQTEMVPEGPCGDGFNLLDAWASELAASYRRMASNPWTTHVLPRKTVELVSVAISAACTNLDADSTRRHIRAALQSGATRDEIVIVLMMASLLSIHSCSLGAPILLEEAKAAGVSVEGTAGGMAATPACDTMRQLGLWNDAWDPFFMLDPVWTDQFMATGGGIYAGGVIEPKLAELLSIAFDASFTHMYAPGTRRHIRAALKLGVTVQEIMEVLKLCVVHGAQAVNMAVPILAEELGTGKTG